MSDGKPDLIPPKLSNHQKDEMTSAESKKSDLIDKKTKANSRSAQ